VTRVVVSASSSLLRAGLESVVRASPGLELAGTAASFASLTQRVEALGPDVVLVALEAHNEDALATLLGDEPAEELDPAPQQKGEVLPLPNPSLGGFPPLVVLSENAESAWIAEALRSGVRAVLPRDSTPDEIVAAVKAAAAGLVVLPSGTVESLLPLITNREPVLRESADQGRNQGLTPREIEVLRMLAEGLGNKEIAWRLRISEHTVKFHISSIFTKLDVTSRTEAVTVGIRQGWVLL
jgi:two-component system, NarL family, response regulator YdfI